MSETTRRKMQGKHAGKTYLVYSMNEKVYEPRVPKYPGTLVPACIAGTTVVAWVPDTLVGIPTRWYQ
eukprot:2388085-Rhodomonas_salina.1